MNCFLAFYSQYSSRARKDGGTAAAGASPAARPVGYEGRKETEMKEIYVHYGSAYFDRLKFVFPKNRPYFCKPHGGFWASPINAEFGWREWCKKEEFSDCMENNCFKFFLSDGAKVFHVFGVSDLSQIPVVKNDIPIGMVCPDFEQMVFDGWDAMELHLSKEGPHDPLGGLYFKLCGWDCDSILILNPVFI